MAETDDGFFKQNAFPTHRTGNGRDEFGVRRYGVTADFGADQFDVGYLFSSWS